MKSGVFVYLAGPISASALLTGGATESFTVEQNIAAALAVFLDLTRRGVPSFCPHLGAAFPSCHGVEYETWMQYDFAVLDRCTHVLMLPRWRDSSGARREYAYAKGKGIRVFESVAALEAAIEADAAIAAALEPSRGPSLLSMVGR